MKYLRLCGSNAWHFIFPLNIMEMLEKTGRRLCWCSMDGLTSFVRPVNTLVVFFQNSWHLENLNSINVLQIVLSSIINSDYHFDRHTAVLWFPKGVRSLCLFKLHVFFSLIGGQLCRIWQLLQFVKWSANTIWQHRVWKLCVCVRK